MKKVLISLLLLLATVLAISVFIISFGSHYTYYFDECQKGDTADKYEVTVTAEPEGVVSYDGFGITDSHLKLDFSAVSQGSTNVKVEVIGGNEPYTKEFTLFVGSFNQILIKTTSPTATDFNCWTAILIGFAIYFTGMAIYLFTGFSRRLKEPKTRFSYKVILMFGIGLQSALLSAILVSASAFFIVNNEYYSAYSGFLLLSQVAILFVLASVPFVLIFGIALTVSNLALIRKEGFRVVNLLGIGISLFMVGSVGVLVMAFVLQIFYDYWFVLGIYSACVALFECLIVATVVTALCSIRRKPEYDKDYIVILGCGIKKDGTLMPLLRGRVDRAIEFYHKQEEISGKRAVFVPSGGKGSDEIIAEGEAMKRYLLSKGIPEKQIMAEDRSTNTLQNMAFSKKLIDERTKNAKVVFSTTNYHVFRSGMLSVQAGLNADGVGSKTKWYFWPNAFIREFIGLVVKSWRYELLAFLFIALLAGANMLFSNDLFNVLLSI